VIDPHRGTGVNRVLRTKSRTLGHGVERGWRSGRAFSAALAVLVGASACGSNGGVQTEVPIASAASIAPSATATQTPAAEDDAILAAYREFFARQTEVSKAPKEERRDLLAPFTADPALDRVLRGMFAAEEFGEVGYGEPDLDPSVESIDGAKATVTDCQDTSKAGRKKRTSGKVTTRGVKEAKAVTTLTRGDDGQWRVTFVDYPDEKCTR
jgi:hypothetical protein